MPVRRPGSGWPRLAAGVMAYTGYIIWGMGADLDTVRLYTIIHNVLGMVLISLFLTHLYMSLFAIKGSLAEHDHRLQTKRGSGYPAQQI